MTTLLSLFPTAYLYAEYEVIHTLTFHPVFWHAGQFGGLASPFPANASYYTPKGYRAWQRLFQTALPENTPPTPFSSPTLTPTPTPTPDLTPPSSPTAPPFGLDTSGLDPSYWDKAVYEINAFVQTMHEGYVPTAFDISFILEHYVL